jgi:putative DNA primase/helicase
MGAAKGIETSLAAAQMFATPVWSALSDRGVETSEPPAGTERLIIFCDNDTGGAGQRAAYGLAARMAQRVKVEIRIPKSTGADWNDVLLNAGTARGMLLTAGR